MFKMPSQVIPWGNDAQIRVQQKGIGNQSYLECSTWKALGKKWVPSGQSIEIPLADVVAAYDECEKFIAAAKRNKRKPGDAERLQALQTEMSKQRDWVKIQVLKANTNLAENLFTEQYQNA